MTCIVGLVHEGKVHIGGDSAGVAGMSMTVRADQKVFKNDSVIMGFSGSFRMGQLLRYSFSPPKRHPDADIYKFMVTDFINAVRDCLKGGGYAERHNESEKGGFFLVGYEGRLFKIESDYQVGENADGYAAIGCGEEIALGAMFANTTAKPRDRLRLALEAAEQFSAGVRGPFHFESA